jgi:hypothetical protein
MKLIKATTAVICLGFLLSISSCAIFRKNGRGHMKAKGSTTVVVKKTNR